MCEGAALIITLGYFRSSDHSFESTSKASFILITPHKVYFKPTSKI